MTITTVTATSKLCALTNVELINLYNTMTGECVKRFSDHKTAVKRCLGTIKAQGLTEQQALEKAGLAKVLEAIGSIVAAHVPPVSFVPAAKPAKPKAPKEPKAPRPSVVDPVLIELMTRPGGATGEQMRVSLGWAQRPARAHKDAARKAGLSFRADKRDGQTFYVAEPTNVVRLSA